jgi:hypothetical protein
MQLRQHAHLAEAGAAERITCPLLVVFGSGDRLSAPSESELLAKAAKVLRNR